MAPDEQDISHEKLSLYLLGFYKLTILDEILSKRNFELKRTRSPPPSLCIEIAITRTFQASSKCKSKSNNQNY